MKEYKIEIEIDEKGNLKAATKGMQGEVCADELDKILKDIPGKQKIKNTPDYCKKQTRNQYRIQTTKK